MQKKLHKLKLSKEERKKKNSLIKEGIIGIKTLKHTFITKNQIEATRKTISKQVKYSCKI
jgi:ribosomal protein L16/L10AE